MQLLDIQTINSIRVNETINQMQRNSLNKKCNYKINTLISVTKDIIEIDDKSLYKTTKKSIATGPT